MEPTPFFCWQSERCFSFLLLLPLNLFHSHHFLTVSIAMNNTQHKASSIGLWSNAAEYRASKQPAVKPTGSLFWFIT
jgi:hypothetical protein